MVKPQTKKPVPQVHGLSSHSLGCLADCLREMKAAEIDLGAVSSLLTDSASMDAESKDAQIAKARTVLSAAQMKLAKATTEFRRAELERNLTTFAKLWQNFIRFSTSGFFFMLAGFALILWAQLDQFSHSSFTFVKVVLGIALLLFGTGTMGTASLSDTMSAGKYSASVAGGAGALAFIIAAGFIWDPEKIKAAFQGQTKYMRVHVKPEGGEYGRWDNFNAKATLLNRPIPLADKGGFLDVYIPYRSNTRKGDKLDVVLEIESKVKGISSITSMLRIKFKKNGELNSNFDGELPVWVPEGVGKPEHATDTSSDVVFASWDNGNFYIPLVENYKKQSSENTDKEEFSNINRNNYTPPLSLPPSVDTGGS